MKQYISETIGTFAMIFCGCGAMTINEITNGNISHVGVAATWGLIVMAMIYAFGETSGAHFNPAVTIGFAYAKKFAWNKVPKYILAQAAPNGFTHSNSHYATKKGHPQWEARWGLRTRWPYPSCSRCQ